MIVLALALAGGVGTTLPSAPAAAPGRVAPLPDDPLRAAIDRRTQGDLRAAAWYYRAALEQRRVTGRTETATRLALGIAYAELGDHALAAEQLQLVTKGEGGLASYGSWYLARSELARHRYKEAAAACATYRSRWPTAPYADECLVVLGEAYTGAGQRGAAVSAFQAYLDRHPDSPRAEPLRLGIALAVASTDPAAGIPLLRELAVDHDYHSTGETARARLEALAAAGHADAVPSDTRWRCREAVELRRCGFEDRAWALYQDLRLASSDDPDLARWVEDQEDRFAWGTKQYEEIARQLLEAHRAKPDAEVAAERYKALTRAGKWVEAMSWWDEAARAHPTAGTWRNREGYARGLLIAGRYAEARDKWTELGKSGGTLGREARFLAAYSAFRAGDAADAVARLGPLAAVGDEEASPARYYRARALDALGREAEAEADRAAILRDDPLSWYAALLRSPSLVNLGPSAPSPGGPAVAEAGSAPPADGAAPSVRQGRWIWGSPPSLPSLTRVGTGPVSTTAPVVAADGLARPRAWELLAWAPSAPSPAAAPAAAPAPAVITGAPAPAVGPVPVVGQRRPDSYAPGFLFDPAEGDRLLVALGAEHGTIFPWATTAADLARVGVFHEAAPLVSRMYDAIDAVGDGLPVPSTPAVAAGTSAASLRAIDLSVEEWRQIFYFVRDDYHAARFSWGATRLASTPEERMVALRRAFPTAEVDALYRHGQAYNVDPFLVLGLMRQESVYRQWALSHAGAIGLLQIMPRTGARVAALMGDRSYSPEQLEDPATNVRYGVWYLARLLDRFEGAFPLAVGSYNGGPHNVGSWLRPWGPAIRMDDFVEQIPYGETKGYIKKVTGYYATYLSLYGPVGDVLDVPGAPRGDHPEIIDF